MVFNSTFRIPGGRGNAHVVEQLSAYLDGELNPGARAEIAAHLERCAECSRELATLRATRQLLRNLDPAPLPRSFLLSPEMVAGKQDARPSIVLGLLPRLRMATAALAVILAVVLSADALSLDPAGNAFAPGQDIRTMQQQPPAAEPATAAASAPTNTTAAAAAPTVTTAAAAAAENGALPFPTMGPPAIGGAGAGGDAGAGGAPTGQGAGAATTAQATPGQTSDLAVRAPGPTPTREGLAFGTSESNFGYVDAEASDNEQAGNAAADQARQPSTTEVLNWLWLEIPLAILVIGLGATVVLLGRRRASS